jgi:hypothetical protein
MLLAQHFNKRLAGGEAGGGAWMSSWSGCFLYPAVCFTSPGGADAVVVAASSDRRVLAALSTVLACWASLLAVCDARTTLYTLCAWTKLLQRFGASAQEWSIFATGSIGAAAAEGRHTDLLLQQVSPQQAVCSTLFALPSSSSSTSQGGMRRLPDNSCTMLESVVYGLTSLAAPSSTPVTGTKTRFLSHEVFDVANCGRFPPVVQDPFLVRVVGEWGVAEGARQIAAVVQQMAGSAAMASATQKAAFLLGAPLGTTNPPIN